jgi:cytochrome P450
LERVVSMSGRPFAGYPIPDPYAVALETIDPSDPNLFVQDKVLGYFERLRREDPVHFVESRDYGPYWSITRHDDIVAVETDPLTFSSKPAVTIADADEDFPLPMFIAMDPPQHEIQRKVVAPIVAGPNLAALEPLIRQRAIAILDALPLGETFDWVDKVSVELTTMMLATLFDIPQEDRRKLARWSDVATARPDSGEVQGEAQRRAELAECLDYFERLWIERAAAPPAGDLISMLAHGEATRDMARSEYLGVLLLLIVAGVDTTRSTISGSVVALDQYPDQWALLKADPSLVPSMVSETLRWQTPLAHMRRKARRDVELNGKTIRRGDKVVMWYLSGNRDETVIERPDSFWIQRPRVRQHLSFGLGIHRCLGNRLGELQLKIIWEEILGRFDRIAITNPPERTFSNFVRGFRTCEVRLFPR